MSLTLGADHYGATHPRPLRLTTSSELGRQQHLSGGAAAARKQQLLENHITFETNILQPAALASDPRHHRPCDGVRRHLLPELVCDAELEKVLHHRQLIRDDQRATRGRRTTGTDSRVRSAEGIEVAREIPEIGKTILGTSYPTR